MRTKEIAEFTKREIGWSKTTTYTVIKKCIEKGIIEEYGFIDKYIEASNKDLEEIGLSELVARVKANLRKVEIVTNSKAPAVVKTKKKKDF